MTRENLNFIVSKEILTQKGNFTVNDIFNNVKNKMIESSDSSESLIKYIRDKMNSMCDDGLIARTETYYFQYD